MTVRIVNSKRFEKPISLFGGAVKGDTLYLERIWIHYGQPYGSEHRLNGVPYDMELQFVFTRFGPSVLAPYYRVLSRITNTWFSFREKIMVILAVFVRITVC